MDSRQEVEEKVMQLMEWVNKQGSQLDHLIASTAQQYCEQQNVSDEDLKLAFDELYKAGDGEDINYMIPHIGVAYSLWYHPRRFNMMCGFLAERLIGNRTPRIQILDLGSGTGVVLWTVAILLKGIEELGLRDPKLMKAFGLPNGQISIKFILTDESEPMLNYAARLFRELKEMNLVSPSIDPSKSIIGWEDALKTKTNRFTWVIASYLFDYDDVGRNTSERFLGALPPKPENPYRVFLLTSGKKQSIIYNIANALEDQGYYHNFYSNSPNNSIDEFPTPFSLGSKLPSVNLFRQSLKEREIVKASSNEAEWYTREDESALIRMLTRR